MSRGELVGVLVMFVGIVLVCGASGCGDDSGPNPATTTDAVGDDASAQVAADATPADLPPSVPPAPVVLEVSEVDEGCAQACERIEDNCHDLSDVGGSRAACEAQCKARATEDPWWIASYVCLPESCDVATCFPANDEPLAPTTACDTLCPALDGCGLFPALDLEAGEVDQCRLQCSGSLQGNPGAQAMIRCIEGAVERCDLAHVDACGALAELPSCSDICGGVYDAGDGRFCGTDTALRATWPDEDDCLSACLAEDDGARLTFAACAGLGKCADPSACVDAPADLDPSCVASCAQADALCGGVDLPEPYGDGCAWACTAARHRSGGPAETDASACLATFDSCPYDEGQGTFELTMMTLGCAIAPTPRCTAACDGLVGCGLLSENASDEGPTSSQCPATCVGGLALADDETEAIVSCIEGVASCEDKAACMGGDE